MRWRSRPDRGAVTAEFAVAVPAVVLVLAACLGGVRVAVERLRITDASALAARSVAREDDPGETAAVVAASGGGEFRVIDRAGSTVCVEVRREVPLLGLPVPVASTGCALAAVAP